MKTFATRRILRIYPTFVVWALVMALAIGAAQILMPDASFWQAKSRFVRLSEYHWRDWFTNLTLTHTWLPRLFGFTPRTLTEVSWTLCYEVQS